MGKYIVDTQRFTAIRNIDGVDRRIHHPSVLDNFAPSILGLGELKTQATQTDAICAFIDLSGFTNFCKQVDPHLSVPDFLHAFITFLFEEIKHETVAKTLNEGAILWHDLPFFVKFMGDGLMILWDGTHMESVSITNLAISLLRICRHYSTRFLVKMRSDFVDLPPVLRCGMARGNIYSVGNGDDYVGPCINVAARLQKLDPLTFAVARRGINLSGKHEFSLRQIKIRGIGDNELVYVRTDEASKLTDEEKDFFRTP